MISALEVARSLYGAYRLALADSGGLSYFNTSLHGFWRSFFAAILVAPFFAFLLTIRFNNANFNESGFRFVAVEGIAYVIGWVLFPLIVYYLAQSLERDRYYIRFVVAYNWSSVIQNAIYLPLAILFELKVIDGNEAGFVNIILLCLVLAYIWFVTKIALDVTALVASSVVFLDVALWIMLNLVAESMLHTSV